MQGNTIFILTYRSSSTQPFTLDPDAMAKALDKLFGMKGVFTQYKKVITKSSLSHFFYHLIFTGKKDEELDSDDLDDDDDDNDDDNDDEAVDNADEEESPGQAEMTETESLKGLRGYMEQMDQELMGTNVGQSFKLAVTNR